MATSGTNAMQGFTPPDSPADPFWNTPGIMCNTCSQKRWLDCDYAANGAPCNNCKHFCGHSDKHRCATTSKSWKGTLLHMAREALAGRGGTALPDPKDREDCPMQHIEAHRMGIKPSSTPPALPHGIQQGAFAAFGVPSSLPKPPSQAVRSRQYLRPPQQQYTQNVQVGSAPTFNIQNTQYNQYNAATPLPPPAPQDQPPLPVGWYSQWDATSQRPYYVQQQTGRTQWNVPHQHAPPPPPPPAPQVQLPPGWTRQWGANRQRHYYFEPSTGRTQWHAPQQGGAPPPPYHP